VEVVGDPAPAGVTVVGVALVGGGPGAAVVDGVPDRTGAGAEDGVVVPEHAATLVRAANMTAAPTTPDLTPALAAGRPPVVVGDGGARRGSPLLAG